MISGIGSFYNAEGDDHPHIANGISPVFISLLILAGIKAQPQTPKPKPKTHRHPARTTRAQGLFRFPRRLSSFHGLLLLALALTQGSHSGAPSGAVSPAPYSPCPWLPCVSGRLPRLGLRRPEPCSSFRALGGYSWRIAQQPSGGSCAELARSRCCSCRLPLCLGCSLLS